MNKHQKALKETKELMSALVTSTLSEGYEMVSPEIAEILTKKGWGEINPDITDDKGNSAARATTAGIAEFSLTDSEEVAQQNNGAIAPAEEKKEMSGTSTFVIEDKLVVKKRASSANPKYPFDQLEIGQSFFIPATEDRPEPWKTLAGAVSVINNKYAEPKLDGDGNAVMRLTRKSANREQREVPATVLTRKFAVQKDTVDGVDGARMGRIEL